MNDKVPAADAAAIDHAADAAAIDHAADAAAIDHAADAAAIHHAADAAVFDPAAAGWERVKAHNFGEHVGPIWRRGDPRFGFVAAEKHSNHIGIVHGGMLATFADQAMGMTAMRATGGKPHATIELNMQYIGAVKIGEFVEANCELVRLTRSIIFMRGMLSVGDRIVASASGVWKILERG